MNFYKPLKRFFSWRFMASSAMHFPELSTHLYRTSEKLGSQVTQKRGQLPGNGEEKNVTNAKNASWVHMHTTLSKLS